MSTSRPQVDPRGPRFGASITAVLLLVVIALGLADAAGAAFALFVVLSALFAWGAFRGIAKHPYAWIFRAFVRPRLAPPAELEDAAPPTFAQGVGFFVTIVGIVLQLVGVQYGLVAAASAAFIAAFLNSVFAYCLGCQLYLLLVRARRVRLG